MAPEGRYSHSPEASAGSGLSLLPVSTTITGLEPHTTYYYRIRAFHPKPGIGNEVEAEEHMFATGPVSIKGQGSTLQESAQQRIFMPSFNAKAHAEGGEVTEYRGTGSAGMDAWGLPFGFGANFTAWQYVGTDQPPNPAQKKVIEEAAGGAKLLTIPTVQAAVAIVIHLPKGCSKATSANRKSPDRLVLANATLEGIFTGTITRWSEVTDDGDALTCETEAERGSPITRVVSAEGSGTAAILKKYLYQLNQETVDGTQTWDGLAEEDSNTRWPHEETRIVRGKGDSGIVAAVAQTYGSIGYASLPQAYASSCFRGPSCETEIVAEKSKVTMTGGEGGQGFWAFVQDNGLRTTGAKYKSPESKGKDGAEGASDCKGADYANGVATEYPPESAEAAWNEVSAVPYNKAYPLCAFSYDLSLSRFGLTPALVQPSELEVAVLKRYFNYMVTEGHALLPGSGYEALPTSTRPRANVSAIALAGVERIG